MSVRLRWLGHSAIYIETQGHRILIDPFFSGNPTAAIPANDAEADFILVSHGHGDHVGDTVSIAKRTGATVVSNYECSEWFLKQGLKNVHGPQQGGSVRLPFGRLKMTQAFHSSSLPDGNYGGNPCGLHLFLNDGTKIYDAADTALFGDMKLIGEEGVDLALLPVGDYYTMGAEDSIRAIKMLTPRKVLPIHYNTFPPIKQDIHAWAKMVRQETEAEPVMINPGDWFEI